MRQSPGGVRVSLAAGIAFLLRCRTQAGHSRPANEDEAKTVAAVAAQCLTWGGWRRWGLIMRYGRLFTPGTDAGGGQYRCSLAGPAGTPTGGPRTQACCTDRTLSCNGRAR